MHAICRPLLFSKLTFSKLSFTNISSVGNRLNKIAKPDLTPRCLQKMPADNQQMPEGGKGLIQGIGNAC